MGPTTPAGRARVGCSGWVYGDWRGAVYPTTLARRDWFGYYAGAFDTVEINNTFYRLPPVETVDQWADQAPPGFEYALKLGQFGSHRMKLRDAATWLPNHVDRVQRLGPALGPTLVQLPPRWRRNPERLDEFLTVAPSSLRWAVEMREPSWLDDSVLEVLHNHGAALCIHDLLPSHPWIRTTDWVYVRFHGPHALRDKYVGRYGGRRLWRAADRLGAWLDEGCDVYAYFNNDSGGAAVSDAAWLRDRLALRSVPARVTADAASHQSRSFGARSPGEHADDGDAGGHMATDRPQEHRNQHPEAGSRNDRTGRTKVVDDPEAPLYTSEPLEDENGDRYVIQQQNVGPGNERGGGEWPDPDTPPQPPAPGAA